MSVSSKNILQEFCHKNNLILPIYETWRDCNNKWYSTISLNISNEHQIFEETPVGFTKKKDAESEIAKNILKKATTILQNNDNIQQNIFTNKYNNICFIDLETHKNIIEYNDNNTLYIGFINKNITNFKRKYKQLINKYKWIQIKELSIQENEIKSGNKLLYILSKKRDQYTTSYFISSLLPQISNYIKNNICIDFYCYGSEYLYDNIFNLMK
jgi:hypothetical protein